jgi:hypothetical protein
VNGQAIRALLLGCLAAVALAGCSNPDAPGSTQATTTGSSPQNAGEPNAPPPPSPASQAPSGVQPSPQRALAAFAERYVNWTYRTLTGDQLTLGAMSVGAARLSEQQAAAHSQADTTIARGRLWNRGQLIAMERDLAHPDMWVIVTREQTGGDSEYEGLPARYHVTLGQLVVVAGGYAVSQWLPQD